MDLQQAGIGKEGTEGCVHGPTGRESTEGGVHGPIGKEGTEGCVHGHGYSRLLCFCRAVAVVKFAIYTRKGL